jgi:8-oxo-dGTP pyrophosphatase MutT (NUDIX family)
MPLGELTPAAVALVVVPGPGDRACFVLTRRVGNLRKHSGQFALPGGRLDEGEDAEQAARRELSEEIGVALEPGAVLGLLDDFETRSGFLITPVVLWAPDALELRPEPSEVAMAFRVPLAELYRPEVPVLWAIPESERTCLSLPLVGTRIHSPTAAIVYQLREVALEGRETRVHDFEQPPFAWS